MGEAGTVKVLSVNNYIMGHATFADAQERILREYAPDIAHRLIRLSRYRHRLVDRVVYRLMSVEPPGSGERWSSRYRLELATSFLARRAIGREVRSETPDVLHLHTQALALMCLPLMSRFPTVISTDGTTCMVARMQGVTTYGALIARERLCFERSRHVMTWCEQARLSLLEDYGLPADKVTVVRPALPLDLFLAIDRRGQPDKEKPGRKLRLLFVGNDFQRKGGEDLLAVFQSALSGRCELDIVSNAAPDMPCLPGLRLHRGLEPLSPALIELYREADVFVMPTREDIFPMVFMEAMAAGLPCVGSALMAVPEMVRDGKTGLTVSPSDRAQLGQALNKLLSDREFRQRAGADGRELVREQFDPVRSCRATAEIFHRALKGEA